MRLWLNSNYLRKGDVFLVNKKNEKYLNNKIKKNACKIVTEENTNYGKKTYKVESINKYIHDFYYDKIKDLILIGITGTNGKTTTCYLIYQILNLMNVKTAYIGTIGFYMDDYFKSLNNTTPSIDILYNLLTDAKKNGCKVVVMEVSSHALKQDRVYGLLFDAIAVTNVTIEHLDYHKNMKDYIKSKHKLVLKTTNKKICVLNKKDRYYKKFINKENNNIILGKDIKIKKIENNLSNTYLEILDNKKLKKINLSLIGNFNVYNFLVAYVILKHLGFNENKILSCSNILEEPKGRMQKINYKNNVIFIDYAHSPDAVSNVLKTVKKIKNKGIITIIGCGGNRDKTKRPLMGKISCRYSKYVIFTNDNPRNEKQEEIINDILKGAKDNFEIIYDRYEAIKKGISMLKQDMILMILGKGHEEYQIIGDKKYYFSDLESTLEIIKKI